MFGIIVNIMNIANCDRGVRFRIAETLGGSGRKHCALHAERVEGGTENTCSVMGRVLSTGERGSDGAVRLTEAVCFLARDRASVALSEYRVRVS